MLNVCKPENSFIHGAFWGFIQELAYFCNQFILLFFLMLLPIGIHQPPSGILLEKVPVILQKEPVKGVEGAGLLPRFIPDLEETEFTVITHSMNILIRQHVGFDTHQAPVFAEYNFPRRIRMLFPM